MTRTSANRWGVGAVAAVCLLGAVPMAQGQGFFQPLFGAFSDNPGLAPARPEPSRPEPLRSLPFASERENLSHPAQPRVRASVSEEGGGGGSQAYCVRTCDGRYFPLSAGDGQSHAASCNSFCPASDTKVVYGSRYIGEREAVSLRRWIADRGLSALASVLYNSAISDMQTCFKLVDREVLNSISLSSEHFDLEPEITAKLLRAGHRIYEVPVSFSGRRRSEGRKYTWRDGMEAAATLVKLRFTRR